jgi:lysophospholipase L1-like esterase
MGGTNDVRNGIPLGTMNDRDNSTYYGALHVLMQGLYTKHIAGVDSNVGKTKKIVILTPIKLLDADKSNLENTIQNNSDVLYKWDEWINAVKEVAAFYSFPVLDMYNLSGINPHLNRTLKGNQDGYNGYYNPYITDGTHPTQEGAEIMSDVLVGFLKTIK